MFSKTKIKTKNPARTGLFSFQKEDPWYMESSSWERYVFVIFLLWACSVYYLRIMNSGILNIRRGKKKQKTLPLQKDNLLCIERTFFFFNPKLTLLYKHRSNPVCANQIFVLCRYFLKYLSASKPLIAIEACYFGFVH